jgi:hypothetical protein
VPSIFPFAIIFRLASDRPEGALIAVHGDDFQISVSRESGQYRSSFKSRDFRILTIGLGNVPLSQNIEGHPCFINAFSMFQDVFKIVDGYVSLCHSENGMLRNIEN